MTDQPDEPPQDEANPPGNWDRRPPQVRQPVSVERAEQVFRLRKDNGWSFKRIGQEIGISRTAAQKLFQKYMEQLRRATVDLAEELVDLEVARLEDLYVANYAVVAHPGSDSEEIARAANVCARIIGVKAKILGMEAEQRIALSGPDGGPISVDHSFNFSGLDDTELDKQVEDMFNPDYMAGASDAFALAEQLAAEGKLGVVTPAEQQGSPPKPKKRKGGKQTAAPTPAPQEAGPIIVSAGQARI